MLFSTLQTHHSGTFVTSRVIHKLYTYLENAYVCCLLSDSARLLTWSAIQSDSARMLEVDEAVYHRCDHHVHLSVDVLFPGEAGCLGGAVGVGCQSQDFDGPVRVPRLTQSSTFATPTTSMASFRILSSPLKIWYDADGHKRRKRNEFGFDVWCWR